jgi:glycosyltransferase involved in cell wall biosynthesis
LRPGRRAAGPERPSDSLAVLYFGTYDRGIGRNAILVDGLRLSGAAVTECCERVWRDTDDKLGALGRAPRAAAVAPRLLRAWVALARRHRHLGAYDVMVVGSTAHLDLPLARLLARHGNRPIVFDPLVSIAETVADRGLLPRSSRRHRLLAALESSLFALPDLVVADTAVHAAALAEQTGRALSGWAVVPAGTPSVYRRLAEPYRPASDGRIRVAYFGQYIPLHGLETVLGAARELRDRPDIAIELVGIGQTLERMRALAAAWALDRVAFVDRWLSPEQLAAEHIAPADLCLGIFGLQDKAQRVVPFKVYTALASGRAVITADTAALREMLSPAAEVWATPAGDPVALAQAIRHLADRPAERLRLASAGQAAYDRRFAPAIVGAQFDAILRRVRDERARRLVRDPQRGGRPSPWRDD